MVRAHGVEPPRDVPPDLQAQVDALLAAFGVAAVADALAARATPAAARQHGPLGNVFLRPMHFPTIGSRIIGHRHFYDHVTFISSGTVAVRIVASDGTETARILTGPTVLFVPKDDQHEFTALSLGVEACCVFSLRDKDGHVVETWNGNVEATQARI